MSIKLVFANPSLCHPANDLNVKWTFSHFPTLSKTHRLSIFNDCFCFPNFTRTSNHNVNNTTLINVAHSLAGSKDVEYRLAQSGDATCSGLENSEYGSRIMTLKRFGPAERCDFPKWFKEPKHWHSLNGELSYNVHQK
jgi:hypothetical protein